MRSSRLVALLLTLQQRGRSTAPVLARELEVSVRTIYRDIAALQAAGVPLWTEPGARGGVRLLEGWRTDLDGLTGPEATALFLAGAPGVAHELGLGAVLVAAQAKLLTTMPPAVAARAQEVRARFHLDAPGWSHHPDRTDHLAAVAEALWACQRLRVGYQRGPATVARELDPLGLVCKAGTWYLVAGVDGSHRTYRVGRLVSVEPTGATFTRPADFDLAATWARSSAEFDRSLLRTRCRLRLSPAATRRLPGVGDHAAATAALGEAGPPDEHGWVEVDLPVESEEVALGQVLRLGDGVEVLAPASLRTALHELTWAMAERHRPGGGHDTASGSPPTGRATSSSGTPGTAR